MTDNSSVSAILDMMIYMWVLVLLGFCSISLDDRNCFYLNLVCVCISNVDINTQLPSGLTTPILPSELAWGCCIMHLLDEGGVRFGVGLLDILYLGKYVHPTTY